MCRRSASFDLTSAQDHPNLPPNDSVKTYCCLCHLIYSIGYVLFCCFCCRRKRQCVGNQKKKSVRCPCFRKKQQDPEQGVMEVDNGSPERKRSCVYRFCYHPLERFFCWTLYLLTCCCCCWVDTVDEKIEMITITPLDQVVLDPDQTQVKQKKKSSPPPTRKILCESAVLNERFDPTRHRSDSAIPGCSSFGISDTPRRPEPENISALTSIDSGSEETLFSFPLPAKTYIHRT